MTLLEELARERTRVTVGTTLSRTIEATAEKMANEILKDPAFREELRGYVSKAFGLSLRTLHQPSTSRKRKRKRPSRK